MSDIRKRSIAFIMAFLMIFQLSPVSVFADSFGGDGDNANSLGGETYYNVKFYKSNGDLLTQQLYISGRTIDEVPEMEMKKSEEGVAFTFTGWEDAEHHPVTADTVVTGDIDAYPVYERIGTVSVRIEYRLENEKGTLLGEPVEAELAQGSGSVTYTSPELFEVEDLSSQYKYVYPVEDSITIDPNALISSGETSHTYIVTYTGNGSSIPVYYYSFLKESDITAENLKNAPRKFDAEQASISGKNGNEVKPAIKDLPYAEYKAMICLDRDGNIASQNRYGDVAAIYICYVNENVTLTYSTNGGSYIEPKYPVYGSNVEVYKNGNRTLTCGKEEHTHTTKPDSKAYNKPNKTIGCWTSTWNNGWEWRQTCGKPEHRHNENCYTTTAGTPVTTRQGYTFKGWYLDSACTIPAPDTITGITEDTVVYAKWTPAQANYTVVFMIENADDANYSYLGSAVVPGTVGDEVDGSGVTMTGLDLVNFTYNHSEPATVKADGSAVVTVYYSRNVYTITWNGKYYNARGSTNVGKTATLIAKYGANITQKWKDTFNTPYPDYAWNFSTNNNDKFVNIDTMPSGNKTVYAFYFSTENVQTLHYWLEGYKGPDGNAEQKTKNGVTYGLYKTIDVKFNYLYDDSEFYEINGYTKGDYEGCTFEASTTNGQQVHFYYRAKTHQIEFYYKDKPLNTKPGIITGADISGEQYYYQPTSTQYPDSEATFAGWYDNSECTGDPYSFTVMPNGNVKLYAKFSLPIKKVTIVFYSDESGEVTQTLTVPKGGTIDKNDINSSIVEEYEREGHTLIGWYDQKEGGNPFDFNKPITENTTIYIYAHWKEIRSSYTVSYVDTNENSLAPSVTYTQGVSVGNTKTANALSINGYLPDETSKSVVIQKNAENKIEFVYSKRQNITYKYKYVIVDGDTQITAYESEAIDAGNKVQIAKVAPSTYTYNGALYYIGANPVTISLVSDSAKNVITFCYYPYKAGKMTVNYVDEEYNLIPAEALGSANPIENIDVGVQLGHTYDISTYKKEISGYQFAGFKDSQKRSTTTTQTATGNKVIYAVYNKNYSLKINYVYSDSSMAATPYENNKLVNGSNYDVISPTITGYTADKPTVSGTINKSNVTETVTYTVNRHTVTYEYDGTVPEGAPTVPAGEYSYNAPVTVAAEPTAPAGYRFLGWTTDDADIASGSFNMPDQDVVIKGTWSLATSSYTINYYLNGTEYKIQDSATVVDQNIGETYVVTAPAIDGYTAIEEDPYTKNVAVLPDGTAHVDFYYYINAQLTANSDEVGYDGDSHEVSGFKIKGVNEDYEPDFSSITVGASGTNAGTYPAEFAEGTVGTVDGTEKYIVTVANDGSLKINPVKTLITVSIKGNDSTVTYNGTEQSVTGYVVTCNGDDYSVSGNETVTISGTDITVSLKSGAAAKATGKDVNADGYSMGLNRDMFDVVSANGNYSDILVNVYDGVLTINKKSVTLASENLEKEYDGTALENGETALKTNSGWVAGEGASFTFTGSQTEAGESANSFSYTLNEGTLAGNYKITKTEGTLTVKEFTGVVTVTTTGGTFTYDGQAHGATVQVEGLTSAYTVETAASNATATHVSNESVTAKCDTLVIKNADGVDVTGKLKIEYVDGYIKINPATLTINTPDASKVYDGEALTAAGTISGFIGEETATFTTTGTQTAVGSSDNTYALTFDKTAAATDYTVSEDIGTLTVDEYAGEITVTTTGFEGTYDGKTHKATVSVSTLPKGYTLVEASSDDEATHVADCGETGSIPAVCDTLVITNAQGENVTSKLNITYNNGTFEITPKTLTVETNGAEKTYDGTALKAAGSIEGFVEGESAKFEVTGSQTAVGSSKNTYAITWEGASAAESDYTVSDTVGTLTVNEYAGKITVTTTGFEGQYDGQAHKASVSVSELPTGYRVVEASSDDTATHVVDCGETGSITADCDHLVIKNAQGVDVTDELDIEYTNGTIKITPCEVELTSGTSSKTYDGTALTNSEVTVTKGSIVEGEDILAMTTGTQTLVGESYNTFDYTFAEGTDKNDYAITVVLGLLTVVDNGKDGPVDPTLVINKSHEGSGFELGKSITFTITAKNIYDTAKTMTISEIEGVVLVQSVFENVEAGAEISTTATHVVTEADILAGKFVNTATVKFGEDGPSYDGEDTAIIAALDTTLTVTKSSDKEGKEVKLGETITYTITVENTGNVSISDITVTDTLNEGAAAVTPKSSWTIAELAPNGKETFTASYTVQEADVLRGTVANSVTAAGTDPFGTETGDDAETSNEVEDPKSGMTISKTATNIPENSIYEIGDTIVYEIVITNTGNVTLSNVVITDTKADNGDGWVNGDLVVEKLSPNDSKPYTAKHKVTLADASEAARSTSDPGKFINTAELTAKAPEGVANPTPEKASETVDVKIDYTLVVNYIRWDRTTNSDAETLLSLPISIDDPIIVTLDQQIQVQKEYVDKEVESHDETKNLRYKGYNVGGQTIQSNAKGPADTVIMGAGYNEINIRLEEYEVRVHFVASDTGETLADDYTAYYRSGDAVTPVAAADPSNAEYKPQVPYAYLNGTMPEDDLVVTIFYDKDKPDIVIPGGWEIPDDDEGGGHPGPDERPNPDPDPDQPGAGGGVSDDRGGVGPDGRPNPDPDPNQPGSGSGVSGGRGGVGPDGRPNPDPDPSQPGAGMIVLVDPTDPSKGYTIVPVAEEDVPLAVRNEMHRDAILPFLFVFVSFLTELAYFDKKKKHLKRVYELKEQLAEFNR